MLIVPIWTSLFSPVGQEQPALTAEFDLFLVLLWYF